METKGRSRGVTSCRLEFRSIHCIHWTKHFGISTGQEPLKTSSGLRWSYVTYPFFCSCCYTSFGGHGGGPLKRDPLGGRTEEPVGTGQPWLLSLKERDEEERVDSRLEE